MHSIIIKTRLAHLLLIGFIFTTHNISTIMTQDERWQAQYDQMMTFMNENHRRPSKHRPEEHDMLNWYKHVKKAIAKGNYPPHRIEKFALLQQVDNKYRRKNQYE